MTEYSTESQRYKDAKADAERLGGHYVQIKASVELLKEHPLRVTDQEKIMKDLITAKESISAKVAVLQGFISLVLDDEIPF
jgi:hypothetical protein